MNVRELMKQDVAVCFPESSLSFAARLMWDHDCGFVPLVDPEDHRLLGTITDRDICMAALSNDRPISQIPIDAAMHRGAFAVGPDDDVTHAHDLMREHRVRRLPVVDDDGKLTGVISLNDLSLAAVQNKQPEFEVAVAETLGAVCQHRELATV